MRRLSLLLSLLLFLAPSPSASAAAASDLSSVTSANIHSASVWLRTTASRANGAFLFTPTVINPRYGNTAALGLLLLPSPATGQPPIVRVQHWMTWYVGHLNWPDSWGVYGTIYDHVITADGKAQNAGSSMSVASNGATFISVAWGLWQRGDRNARRFLLQMGSQSPGHLFDVIGTSVIQVMNTGSQAAHYDRPLWLPLTSACDIWRGLADLASLFEEGAFNHSHRAAYFRGQAAELAERIERELWSEAAGLYLPHVGAKSVNLRVWHPDAVSQVYPIVYGLVSPSSARARAVWASLKEAWPGLGNYSHTAQDPTPWEIVSFAAVLMGDVELARARLDHSARAYVAAKFPFPWTCEEAGWYLHTNTFLALRATSLPFV